MVQRPSVRMSIPSIHRSRFAAKCPVGRRYRSIAAGAVLQARWRSAANAGSVTLTAYGEGSTQTCYFRITNTLFRTFYILFKIVTKR